MLVPCSDQPGVSHMPTSEAPGGVSSTQARWAENREVAPLKETLGMGKQGLGWLKRSPV